ncbi:recombinase family protein [Bacillus sp. ISL-40]|nr:recombinase family protein [Bacillus sp. ISL-40]MBT2744703.1 recombinase family protein [Bacillus sp. ISL-77]
MIAAYLRKSREDKDTEDTLRKHREQLQEYLDRNGFKNVIWFEEIGSGESIEGRPVFSALLPRIEAGEFDAVLCVHIDRLSRGSQTESGMIQEAFEESGTILLTLEKVYDFTNEADLMLSEFQGTISRNELRSIKRRLRDGKKKAVQDGRPHSGNPPYGYKWDRNTKTCKIDEQKSKIYRLLIQWYLEEGLSGALIADRLNEMKVPTASSKGRWHGEVVTELLAHDFHRGFVVYGKYKSEKRIVDGEKKYVVKRNKDADKIIVARGNHEPLKSEEEHAAITKRLETLRTYNMKDRQVRKNTYRLSGLVYCPYCGKCQNVNQPKGRHEHLRKCLKKSTTRKPECDNTQGIAESVVMELILDHMRQFKEELFAPNNEHREEAQNSLNEIIEIQRQSIEKSKRRIVNAMEMRLDGDIDKTKFKAIKDKEEAAIRQAEAKAAELKASIGYLDKAEEQARLERWSSDEVSRLLNGEDFAASETNGILRKLIERVHYWVKGEKVTVEIKYK